MLELRRAEALFKKGFRLQSIAYELGRSYEGVRHALRKSGSKRWRVWTPEDDATMSTLYHKGVPAKQIAKRLQRTLKAVYRRAEHLGLTRRRDK